MTVTRTLAAAIWSVCVALLILAAIWKLQMAQHTPIRRVRRGLTLRPSASPAAPQPLKLLTMNLHMLPGMLDAFQRWQAVERRLSHFDVVCFQELFESPLRVVDMRSHAAASCAAKGLSNAVATDVPPIVSAQFLDGGLFIASRCPILETTFHPFRVGGKHSDYYAVKGVLYAALWTPSGVVHVLTTHLQALYVSHPDEPTEVVQDTQVREILAVVERHAPVSLGEPVVVCGDFNIDARDGRRWLGLRRAMAGAGFAFAGPSVADPPTAWEGADPVTGAHKATDCVRGADSRLLWTGRTLDHVWVRHAAHSAARTVSFAAEAPFPSDHMPVTCTVTPPAKYAAPLEVALPPRPRPDICSFPRAERIRGALSPRRVRAKTESGARARGERGLDVRAKTESSARERGERKLDVRAKTESGARAVARWMELAKLPREDPDPENDMNLELAHKDGPTTLRVHASWFSVSPTPHGDLVHGWHATDGTGDGGYYMYLGRFQSGPQALGAVQTKWVLGLLRRLGATRLCDVEVGGHAEFMADILAVHRDRVDPLPLRDPAYIYARLSPEEICVGRSSFL